MGPEWHTPIIDIRDLYFDIVDRILNPPMPQLRNTDGDPMVLTTLTFTLDGSVAEVAKRLTPLGRLTGEESDDDKRRPIVEEIRQQKVPALIASFETGQAERLPNGRAVLDALRATLGLK